jgi:hypothetical protein
MKMRPRTAKRPDFVSTKTLSMRSSSAMATPVANE